MRRVRGFLPTVLLLLAFIAGACGSESVPTSPGVPAPLTSSALSVTTVFPQVTFGGSTVRIDGTGFIAGASVVFGGALATNIAVASATVIRVTAPRGITGTVDVVVTNPDGQSARLPAGFTFNVVTLTPSRTTVPAGAEISVTWTSAQSRCSLDWIGLYEVGATNENYGPWVYTSCGTDGTARLNAPLKRGQHEFRYLPDDGYEDVARSVTVTVE
ncbi:MAG TPA: IPT/TIG domain-containing protein [Vicinamibacterales bacterium]|nr:IPT/TIG domain-containing protein [Vicinamibacterales bacterium]